MANGDTDDLHALSSRVGKIEGTLEGIRTDIGNLGSALRPKDPNLVGWVSVVLTGVVIMVGFVTLTTAPIVTALDSMDARQNSINETIVDNHESDGLLSWQRADDNNARGIRNEAKLNDVNRRLNSLESAFTHMLSKGGGSL